MVFMITRLHFGHVQRFTVNTLLTQKTIFKEERKIKVKIQLNIYPQLAK